MSSISNDIAKLKSSALNTTINAEVLAAFRLKCKQQGVQMNTIIEAFMRQYIKGGFYLKFGRDTGTIEVELDESEVDSVDIAHKKQDSIKDNFGELVGEED